MRKENELGSIEKGKAADMMSWIGTSLRSIEFNHCSRCLYNIGGKIVHDAKMPD